MSHYEERLEADLNALRELVVAQAADVRRALSRATQAFLAMDRQAASEGILGDHPINRRARAIDRMCHAFVARHVPGAGHLRFVSSVMRMNISLERLGDYAVTIDRETAQLKEPPPEEMARDIQLLADHGDQTLRQAVTAFRERSEELARSTIQLAGKKGRLFHTVFTDLLAVGEQRTRCIEDLFGILVVLYRLERVRDQAKNLCEETIFIATGAVKQPKVYDVLFVDEHNDRLSQMAEAIARKAFPRSGRFRSAGWEPADRVDPAVVAFMDAHGLETDDLAPARLDPGHDALVEHHVIVSLEGDAWSRIPELPFHTVLLEWDVGPNDGAASEADLDESRRRLTEKIRELMDTLRGEEAA